MIIFGMYRLAVHDTTFQIWYGAWPSGYFVAASGQISDGNLCVQDRHPFHKIPPRAIIELQKRFNPRIIQNAN